MSARTGIALALVLAAGGAPTAQAGTIAQLPGKDGCLVDRAVKADGCTPVRGLAGPAPFMGSHALAISPDGRSVYVASSVSDTIAVLTRNRSTGTLRQPAGAAGCIGATAGCAPAVGLDAPNSVAISADGRSVYATARGSSSVTTFTRNRTTGALTQAGCIADEALAGCTDGRALGGADAVAVSRDGRSVYAVAFGGDAVAVFSRSTSTGALTQLDGAAGCIAEQPADGCATGIALGSPEGVAVSPDGRNVHVASALSNALLTFSRDPSTGALTQRTGAGGCIVSPSMPGCATGRGLLGANDVTISADGASVYASSLISSSLTAFVRNPATGALRALPGAGGCVTGRKAAACAAGRAFGSPEGLAVAPDGESVYVTSFASDAIAVLDRDRRTGAVTQRPGRSGCVSLAGGSCARGRGLNGVSSVAVSPDGRFVYAAAFRSNAVTVFGRTRG